MRRVVCQGLTNGIVSLDEAASHYVRDVLRLGVGDSLTLFDGEGHEAQGTIVRGVVRGAPDESSCVTVEVGDVAEAAQPRCRLTIALAVPKGSRSDWAVEKLTELGVDEVIWLECERSVVVPERDGARHNRWERVAQAAARQAGRATVPSTRQTIDVETLAGRNDAIRLVGDASAKKAIAAIDVFSADSVLIAVGPEGGFAVEELHALIAAGFVAVKLGPHILRTETAAVAGAAQVVCRILSSIRPDGVC